MDSIEMADRIAALEKKVEELKALRVVEYHHHHYPAPVSYPVYVYPSYPNYLPQYPYYPVWGSSVLGQGNTSWVGSSLQCNAGDSGLVPQSRS